MTLNKSKILKLVYVIHEIALLYYIWYRVMSTFALFLENKFGEALVIALLGMGLALKSFPVETGDHGAKAKINKVVGYVLIVGWVPWLLLSGFEFLLHLFK